MVQTPCKASVNCLESGQTPPKSSLKVSQTNRDRQRFRLIEGARRLTNSFAEHPRRHQTLLANEVDLDPARTPVDDVGGKPIGGCGLVGGAGQDLPGRQLECLSPGVLEAEANRRPVSIRALDSFI